MHANTHIYKESFLPSVIRLWNALPTDTKESATITSFKRKINSSCQKPKPFYYWGSRKGQVYHTRLRLGCSSLNYDLYRKSISDSPNCQCGDIETVAHFLLACPLFTIQRNTFLVDLPCPPTHQHLLYGSELLDEEHNRLLFSKVQEYIVATRRFGT